jgi:hypothetical protein
MNDSITDCKVDRSDATAETAFIAISPLNLDHCQDLPGRSILPVRELIRGAAQVSYL